MISSDRSNAGLDRHVPGCATGSIPPTRPVRAESVRPPCRALVVALRRLFGKEEKSFELLARLAQEALNGVRVVAAYLRHPAELKTLDEFVAMRRRNKAVKKEINEGFCTHRIARLDPEDVASLARALSRISKATVKIAERLSVAPPGLKALDLAKQVPFMEKAAETVVEMVRELHQGMNPERAGTLQARLEEVERDAGKVLVELLRGLYSDHCQTLHIIFLKDLFELQERVADRCRDAGELITSIVLKSV